jgi:hypothetical protein
LPWSNVKEFNKRSNKREVEEKAAGQDKCKRLLGAMLEYHLTIMKFYLKNYRLHMDKYWDFEYFEEREQFLDDLMQDVQLNCRRIS